MSLKELLDINEICFGAIKSKVRPIDLVKSQYPFPSFLPQGSVSLSLFNSKNKFLYFGCTGVLQVQIDWGVYQIIINDYICLNNFVNLSNSITENSSFLLGAFCPLHTRGYKFSGTSAAKKINSCNDLSVNPPVLDKTGYVLNDTYQNVSVDNVYLLGRCYYIEYDFSRILNF